MKEKSKIQWTDYTWNPWVGCKKIMTGCKNCYMFRDMERYGQNPELVHKTKPNTFNAPLKIKTQSLFFVCSWSDFFISDADPFRNDAWDIIKKTPYHYYLIPTKRPENIEERLPVEIPDNFMLGISVSNSLDIETMYPILESLKYRYGIPVFLSIEPLLEDISKISDIMIEDNYGDEEHDRWFQVPDWIIVGGESGNDTGNHRYRECKIEWILNIIQKCQYFDIPVFVKQLGVSLAKELNLSNRFGDDISKWPCDFRFREWPVQILERGLK